MIRERVITAAILVPVVLAALLHFSVETLVAVLALVVAYAAWEWSRFVAPDSLPWRIFFAVVIVDLIAAYYLVFGLALKAPWLLEIAVAVWFLMIPWLMRYPMPLPGFVAFLTGALILPFAWISLSLLAIAGWQWLLFLLMLVWAADVGAYFAGKRFGVRKLAPAVSPGKTWAGVVGGMLLSLLVALAGAIWFAQPALPFVALGLVTAMISVVGDLVVSMFKRSRGMKDSGRLLPGHGGLLDRIDSLLSAAPLLALGLGYLGVIQ